MLINDIGCALLKFISIYIIAAISWLPVLRFHTFLTQELYGRIIFHSLAVFVQIYVKYFAISDRKMVSISIEGICDRSLENRRYTHNSTYVIKRI